MVPKIATDETSRVVSAVAGGPNRSAAQTVNGKTRYERGLARRGVSASKKSKQVMAVEPSRRAAPSAPRPEEKMRFQPVQVSRAGATTRTPMASPSHQTCQREA